MRLQLRREGEQAKALLAQGLERKLLPWQIVRGLEYVEAMEQMSSGRDVVEKNNPEQADSSGSESDESSSRNLSPEKEGSKKGLGDDAAM
jgi:hypothetical protein